MKISMPMMKMTMSPRQSMMMIKMTRKTMLRQRMRTRKMSRWIKMSQKQLETTKTTKMLQMTNPRKTSIWPPITKLRKLITPRLLQLNLRFQRFTPPSNKMSRKKMAKQLRFQLPLKKLHLSMLLHSNHNNSNKKFQLWHHKMVNQSRNERAHNQYRLSLKLKSFF